jgi:hypothetical protein
LEEDISLTEPGVIPLSHLGVVDIDGVDVTETELMAHALANCSKPTYEEDYMIRRGSAVMIVTSINRKLTLNSRL